MPLFLCPFCLSFLQFFISSFVSPPSLCSYTSSIFSSSMWHSQVYPLCFRPGEPVRRKIIPRGARGVGSGLCPWSRCLTWAKPAKQPPCQGSSPGCKPGAEGSDRWGGDRRRSTGVTCPLKQTTSYTFFTPNIICLSVLLLSPVAASTVNPQTMSRCFCPLSLILFFLCFWFWNVCNMWM